MVSGVLSSLVLSVNLLPAVWGLTYSCSSYWDKDDFYHDTQQCGTQYCCGDCNKKYCCSEKKYQLTQEKQESCPARPGKTSKIITIGTILGVIFGSIVVLIPCVALIICCVTPCCLIHRKLQERRNQRNQTVVVSVPQQPPSPTGYQISHPGYQLVPEQPGCGAQPIPTAPPPSYLEATDPAHFPAPFIQGQPINPLQPSGQPNAPPLHSEEFSPPYNPSYDLHS